MAITATITNIETINSPEGRLNQPIVNITLDINRNGVISQVAFSEMLSNLYNKTDAELLEWFTAVLSSYAAITFKGEEELSVDTRVWSKAANLVGKSFDIAIERDSKTNIITGVKAKAIKGV